MKKIISLLDSFIPTIHKHVIFLICFQAKGKIIVYNQIYVSYGVSVQYRAFGAREAAKVGGVASLIRSVTPFSIYSPHTGWQVLYAKVH